jgi:hypothetical protein
MSKERARDRDNEFFPPIDVGLELVLLWTLRHHDACRQRIYNCSLFCHRHADVDYSHRLLLVLCVAKTTREIEQFAIGVHNALPGRNFGTAGAR